MAITLDERPDSGVPDEGNSGEVTIKMKYVFEGTNNYSDLRTYVLLHTPVIIPYAGVYLGRKSWSPEFQPGTWGYVELVYSSFVNEQQALQPEGPGGESTTPSPETPTDEQKLDSNWTLTTRGGSVNIKQSKETKSKTLNTAFLGTAWAPSTTYTVGARRTNGGNVYTCTTGGTSAGSGGPSGTGTGIVDNTVRWSYVGPVPTAPDNQRAIGLSKDGVAGVDVPAMKCTASITIPIDLKLPLVRTLARIDEPHTNSQPWLGSAAGEWLYVGMDAQGATTGPGTLTIHLEGGQNLNAGDSRLVISPTLTLPAKGAHDYVWFLYQDSVEAGQLWPVPKAAYVERIWDSMNFATVFGFG
jgi:hypothetical protein